MPMVRRPVRNGCSPKMNEARSAVQLCCAWASVNSAPSLATRIEVRRLVAHNARVVDADIMHTDIIAPDHEDVWLLVLRVSCAGEQK